MAHYLAVFLANGHGARPKARTLAAHGSLF